MIKAVLFDYGGVMTQGGGTTLTDKLAKNLSISSQRALEVVFSPAWRKYIKGKITQEEFWRETEEFFNMKIPAEKRIIWDSVESMRPLPEMIDLLNQLKHTYKVGLISNALPHTAIMIEKAGFYDIYDFKILSNEVGSAKPEVEIYNSALEKLPGVKAEEVVFVDDQERCLPPARELGMQTILAQNPTQIKKDLERLLS